MPKAGYPLELIEVGGSRATGFAGDACAGSSRVPRALLQSRAILKRARSRRGGRRGRLRLGAVVLAAALERPPDRDPRAELGPGHHEPACSAASSRRLRRVPERGEVVPAEEVSPRRQPGAQDACATRCSSATVGEARRRARRRRLAGRARGQRAGGRSDEASCSRVGQAPRLVHQTGDEDRDDFVRRYAEAGIDAEVRAFIDDMARRLSRRRGWSSRARARRRWRSSPIVGKPADPDSAAVRRRRPPDGQRARARPTPARARAPAAGDDVADASWPRRSRGLLDEIATLVARWPRRRARSASPTRARRDRRRHRGARAVK